MFTASGSCTGKASRKPAESGLEECKCASNLCLLEGSTVASVILCAVLIPGLGERSCVCQWSEPGPLLEDWTSGNTLPSRPLVTEREQRGERIWWDFFLLVCIIKDAALSHVPKSETRTVCELPASSWKPAQQRGRTLVSPKICDN